MRWLTSLRHPEGFHGHGRTRNFFEGWYVKLVSADESQRWAVIPGLFLGPDGSGEAFIQLLDGVTRRSWYRPFPVDAFHARADGLDVRVGASHLRRTGLTLALDDGPLVGEVHFSALHPWPVTLAAPGIMGPFAFAPFMECYHGVVSLWHTLSGTLEVEGRPVSFDGGVGYLEKDWGQAFPSGYVWMQSSHFPGRRASLVASAAIIPWLGTSFPGFIAGLWLDGTLHRFATYTGARLERLELGDTEVYLSLVDRRHRLEVVTGRRQGGLLHAPVRTEMHRRVEESLDARLDVTLSTLDGREVFRGQGTSGGLEVHGDTGRLTAMANGARQMR